jgi:hypothetical protein
VSLAPALLTDRAVRWGVNRSTAELEVSIEAYVATTNADPKVLPLDQARR